MRTKIRALGRVIGIGTILAGLSATHALAQELDANVKSQIDEIIAAKRKLTPTQKKVSMELLLRSKAMRGELRNSRLESLFAAPQGRRLPSTVEVDIKGEVGDELLNAIKAAGGTILNSHPEYNAIRAIVPLASMETLAAEKTLTSIVPAELMTTNVGVVTSQGYITHAANLAFKAGYKGAGVKVGVISDSATAARVSALIASGDLKASTTVLEASTGTDEGAAMMEIVQDIAPEAQIYFATANGGQAHMATNIAALAAAGCSIIVDDVSYFAEGAFQDGPIAQAVNTFVAGGGIYLSSAANSGNLSSGTSGTYEADFLNGGAVSGPIATAGETGFFHNFGTAGSPVLFDTVTATSTTVTLKWSDPLGGSPNDYDIFLVNSTGTTLKAFSAAVQNGTQDPVELFQTGGMSVGDRIYVVLFSGAQRALRVDMHRGRLSIATAGSTFGHNAAGSAYTIAAVGWSVELGATKAFSGGAANPVEVFSSDGPRKIFYNPNGTAITPGNILFGTNGGTTLQKPDFSGADGGFSKTTGFLPFFGTSAAAPHVAGIIALMKSAKPSATQAEIRTALAATALDIMAAGVDKDSGAGIVMALPAINYLLTH